MNNNPFAALFNSTTEDTLGSNSKSPSDNSSETPEANENLALISAESQRVLNNYLEDVFRVTLDNSPVVDLKRPSSCVYLPEVRDILGGSTSLTIQSLEHVVFERLLLTNPTSSLLIRNHKDQSSRSLATEAKTLNYLFLCYYRSLKNATSLDVTTLEHARKEIKRIISLNTSNVLMSPDIYSIECMPVQFTEFLFEFQDSAVHQDLLVDFVDVGIAQLKSNEDVDLLEVFNPILNLIAANIRACNLTSNFLAPNVKQLSLFSRNPTLAKVLMAHSSNGNVIQGKNFEQTLIGSIMSISCLPKSDFAEFEFFVYPSQQGASEHRAAESNLGLAMNRIQNEAYHMLLTVIKQSPECKDLVLTWLGRCLELNTERARIWNAQAPDLVNSTSASDAFFINLGGVLLQFCKPFALPNSPKMQKIDAYYCSYPGKLTLDQIKAIHLRGLEKETCLIPFLEGESVAPPKDVGFITECFFMTHRCLQLGFNVVHNKLIKVSQDLGRIQRIYEEALAQGGNDNVESFREIKTAMKRRMTKYLSLKAALMESESLDCHLNFVAAASQWLCNYALSATTSRITFPLDGDIKRQLAYIPEFILDNIAEFILFTNRFSPTTLELAGNLLDPILLLVVLFMGDERRLNNPHLRARLAEVLEAIMPNDEENPAIGRVSTLNKERLFQNCQYAEYIIPNLIEVFVSIEMTGQSVAFEQKFNYRRPMYTILEYSWNYDVHKIALKRLASDAEACIEAIDPPLFLRFINLLINDAIFLLDEAFVYMSRLREQQIERDSGNWAALSPQQRREREGNFTHQGMLARFHNVMGNATIRTLKMITVEIKSIFTHSVMVDRIAALLNYFLLNLVGPKKRNLKVKDLSEYEFKPRELVSDIVGIYLNLGENNRDFCLAVARDGRSYSKDLFVQAEQVLSKIGKGDLIGSLRELALTIENVSAEQKAEEDALGDIPEEYLDPIMGTIMVEPITLPASSVTVDRSTIARHLLSDQTDPFNRTPLRLQDCISNEALKMEITQWREHKISKQ